MDADLLWQDRAWLIYYGKLPWASSSDSAFYTVLFPSIPPGVESMAKKLTLTTFEKTWDRPNFLARILASRSGLSQHRHAITEQYWYDSISNSVDPIYSNIQVFWGIQCTNYHCERYVHALQRAVAWPIHTHPQLQERYLRHAEGPWFRRCDWKGIARQELIKGKHEELRTQRLTSCKTEWSQGPPLRLRHRAVPQYTSKSQHN